MSLLEGEMRGWLKSYVCTEMKIGVLAIALMSCVGSLAQDSSYFEIPTLKTEVIAGDLKIPWDLCWGPDGNIWFTERDGNISRLDPVTGELRLLRWEEDVFQTIENSGMHSMALHPNFPDEPYVFVHYCYESRFNSKIVRYKYFEKGDSLGERQRLLWLNANTSHNGSRIVFDSDSTFFFSLGDAYSKDEFPQDTLHKNGKVLHMKTDGSAPSNNPIDESLVWSIGHRNPQGLVLADNGMLYSCEHGTNENDELNLIEKFRNYGWPHVAGACDHPEENDFCESLNVREPIMSWSPTVAPCGLEYYGSNQIPEWQNSLLVCTMKGRQLKLCKLSDDGLTVVAGKNLFHKEFGRIRDVLAAPDGSIYISTSNNEVNGWSFKRLHDDRIIRIYDSRVHEPIVVRRNLSDQVHIYTDQFQGIARISYFGAEDARVVIYDDSGEEVLSRTMNNEVLRSGEEGLENGSYTVVVSRREERLFDRFVLH